jgi:hypothetical protein
MHRAGVTPMPYTIKTKSIDGFGVFSVIVDDARGALNILRGMVERGIKRLRSWMILGQPGICYSWWIATPVKMH